MRRMSLEKVGENICSAVKEFLKLTQMLVSFSWVVEQILMIFRVVFGVGVRP